MKNQKKKNTEIPPRVIALRNFNVKCSLELTNKEIKKFGYGNLNEKIQFILKKKKLCLIL